MRAVGVVPKRREVRLIEATRPEIADPYDVKIRTLEVGICGTDREICTFAYGAPPPGSEHLVLGHECLGQVVEVGPAVSVFHPGDLVVPSIRRPCPHADCRACRLDQQDFCSTDDFTERGIKLAHGFMTEYFVESEMYLTLAPAEVRDVAVLAEPLTVTEKALTQIWQIRQRFPWTDGLEAKVGRGQGLRALVLGAGPVGILGTMALLANGVETFVYSRAPAPGVKSELIDSLGAKYFSSSAVSIEQLAKRLGHVDLVYEAVGTAEISFQVMKVLGTNGIFVFTGIPVPRSPIALEADLLMRNMVLKNQLMVGIVNANADAFRAAVRDLGLFLQRWPGQLRALITGRHKLESFRELLLGEPTGIKNIIVFD